jgi:spermidine/putrescine ABC transporter ATP-binding subunit
MNDVELRGVTKRYDGIAAVQNVDLTVGSGEFVAILGPSGCGKTTTLRLIAGFLRPDAGTVSIRGQVVNDVPPHKRDFSMVFQNYALFPHLSVYDNIAFGLKITRVAKEEIRQRVARVLDMVNLTGLESRLPRQLSGGQQQRVALARAIVMNPAVLLLDEPLSNLDLKMRQSMRIEIKQIQQKLGITTIFVTHDQEEALTMSDRIVVMHQGRIEQIGTPCEIYERPKTTFVADFIGFSNLIPGNPARAGSGGAIDFVTDTGLCIRTIERPDIPLDEVSNLLIRPERIRIETTPPTNSSTNVFTGTIRGVVYLGAVIRYQVEAGGLLLTVDSTNTGRLLHTGDDVYLSWAPEDALLLQRSSGF